MADDTAYIQGLIDANHPIPVPGAGRAAEFVYPAVWLEPRRHTITRRLLGMGSCRIASEGRATIEQTDPTADILVFDNGYDVSVGGITFLGGRTAIRFGNNNVNSATLNVGDCHFQKTNGPAVIVRPNQPGPPNMSSQVTFDRCRWVDCKQALVSHADSALVRDSWLQWGHDPSLRDVAAIECRRGAMTLTNIVGVPEFSGPQFSRGCRWIDHYGTRLTVDASRFGGEYAGLPCINQFGKPDVGSPWQGPSIVLRASQLSSGHTSDPGCGVVVLRGGLFSVMSVDDGCTGVLPGQPLVRDLDGTSERLYRSLQHKERIQIGLGANVFWPVIPAVPPWMGPLSG